MNDTQPDAHLARGLDAADLYRNVTINGKQTKYDRVIITHGREGIEEDFVFHRVNGELKVDRVRQTFDVVQGSVSSTPTFNNVLEEVTDQDDKKRLSEWYDDLLKTANKK